MILKGKACVTILVGRSTSSHEDICNRKKMLQELHSLSFVRLQSSSLLQVQYMARRALHSYLSNVLPNSSIALKGDPLYSPKARAKATVVKLRSPPANAKLLLPCSLCALL